MCGDVPLWWHAVTILSGQYFTRTQYGVPETRTAGVIQVFVSGEESLRLVFAGYGRRTLNLL